MACSMICVTDSSAVRAAAPGYTALMVTAGGAMIGYCEIGSRVIEMMPVMLMISAMTQATIGRSMKKRDSDMAGAPQRAAAAAPAGPAAGGGAPPASVGSTGMPGCTFCRPSTITRSPGCRPSSTSH